MCFFKSNQIKFFLQRAAVQLKLPLGIIKYLCIHQSIHRPHFVDITYIMSKKLNGCPAHSAASIVITNKMGPCYSSGQPDPLGAHIPELL